MHLFGPNAHPYRECRSTYALRTPSIRDCQPSPVALKYATTSGLYRTETNNFLCGDFGRPRSVRNGTIAFNCFGVRGLASGSDRAAAAIILSSSTEGIATTGFLRTFDIELHLSPRSSAKTDDAAGFSTLNEGDVVKNTCARSERTHSQFFVLEALVDPRQGSVSIHLSCEGKRHAVPGPVSPVFGRTENDTHALP